MACRSTHLFDLVDDRIFVTVHENFSDELMMSRSLAFQPQFIPGPAPVMGLARFKCFLPGKLINVGQHKYFSGLKILNYCRQQAIPLIKAQCWHGLLFIGKVFRVGAGVLAAHKMNYACGAEFAIFFRVPTSSLTRGNHLLVFLTKKVHMLYSVIYFLQTAICWRKFLYPVGTIIFFFTTLFQRAKRYHISPQISIVTFADFKKHGFIPTEKCLFIELLLDTRLLSSFY
jgi:hypothetical protein